LRAAIYLRVSTGEQTVDPQRQALQKILELRGWTLVKEYADEGISGAKARDQRPGFDAMCKAATRREFDIVVAWSIDRISRSLINLITFMNELNAVGVQLYVHQQAFDSMTPSGKLMLQVAGAFAEFERTLIGQRIKIGFARAKARGKQFGKRTILTPELVQKAVELRAEGKSATEIGKELECAPRSVWRALRKASNPVNAWE
jgi:DNA invertase Pin-like site-specific DNA recombinase